MNKQPQKPPVVVRGQDRRQKGDLWLGLVDGETLNANVTVLFFATEEIGAGARWHVHPYDEVFVIREGHARFKVGNETFDVEAGDVLMGPAGVPHKFKNLGPGRFETTDIHLSSRWIQTDLEDPDLTSR